MEAEWATTLVVATDAWRSARTGFSRLLGRGDQQLRTLTETRLEELAAGIAAVGCVSGCCQSGRHSWPNSSKRSRGPQASWKTSRPGSGRYCPLRNGTGLMRSRPALPRH